MIYPDLLKGDFDRLPQALRDFHSASGGGRARGTASVRHASGLLARLAGFPPEGENVPLQLEVLASENQEVWIRRFGNSVLKSVQRRTGNLLAETFGPLEVLIRITADESGMRFDSERVRWWIIPLPLRVTAREHGDESRWEFEVNVGGVGSYRGVVGPV